MSFWSGGDEKRGSHLREITGLCGEGIYPRWAAKRPQCSTKQTVHIGLATAAPPNGDESPRHRRYEKRLLDLSVTRHVLAY